MELALYKFLQFNCNEEAKWFWRLLNLVELGRLQHDKMVTAEISLSQILGVFRNTSDFTVKETYVVTDFI